MILCNSCISNCTQSLDVDPPFLKSPEGHSLTLSYEAEDEDCIVKEIVAMVDVHRPPLTVSFLLSLCLQYSSACLQTSDLRRLLLLIASDVQSAMWVSCDLNGAAALSVQHKSSVTSFHDEFARVQPFPPALRQPHRVKHEEVHFFTDTLTGVPLGMFQKRIASERRLWDYEFTRQLCSPAVSAGGPRTGRRLQSSLSPGSQPFAASLPPSALCPISCLAAANKDN